MVLLTFGIALVQLPAHETPKEEGFFHKHFSFHTRAVSAHTPSHDIEGVNPTLGLVTVFASCMLSGAAGVYFEKVLKGSNATLWGRNVQLSFFSLFPALFIGVLWKDGSEVLSKVTIITVSSI